MSGRLALPSGEETELGMHSLGQQLQERASPHHSTPGQPATSRNTRGLQGLGKADCMWCREQSYLCLRAAQQLADRNRVRNRWSPRGIQKVPGEDSDPSAPHQETKISPTSSINSTADQTEFPSSFGLSVDPRGILFFIILYYFFC